MSHDLIEAPLTSVAAPFRKLETVSDAGVAVGSAGAPAPYGLTE
jgi:hypothetical protein